ncbi:unnamed protein product [Polarella glacialis]|uniref:Calpain catalytic domain-containing protein n=1 Tax=Polarella glacialis TaxID=89957 RepID=A0A813JYV0_POLGL|nr:unnamed protein product [Polarella glacialis]
MIEIYIYISICNWEPRFIKVNIAELRSLAPEVFHLSRSASAAIDLEDSDDEDNTCIGGQQRCANSSTFSQATPPPPTRRVPVAGSGSSKEVPPTRRWGRPLGVTVSSAGTTGGYAVSSSSTALPPGEGWRRVHGDDALDSENLRTVRKVWQQTVAKCSSDEGRFFEDPEFPAEPRSVCGKDEESKLKANDVAPPRCRCGAAAGRSEARLLPTRGSKKSTLCGPMQGASRERFAMYCEFVSNSQVRKEGPTKGRPYWHCEVNPSEVCTDAKYLYWRLGVVASSPWQIRSHVVPCSRAAKNHARSVDRVAVLESRVACSKMWWQRFPEFLVVSDFGFRAEDLRQGGVGDCWFMSASHPKQQEQQQQQQQRQQQQ